MTNPNDPRDADFRSTLPEDLQGLDRELSGIRIEERPSFGPELEKELAEAWKKRPRSEGRLGWKWSRALLAAGVAGLMIAGLSVPSARAAVGGLVRSVAEEAFPGFFAQQSEVEPEPEVVLPEVEAQEPEPEQPEPRAQVVVSPVDPSEEVEPSVPEVPSVPIVPITFPAIENRQEAQRIIASHYPPDLQEAGVEGTVLLRFWVDAQGRAQNMNLAASSGNRRLDYAAMRAAEEVAFRPATRNGVAVGTLVEVQIHFFALSGAGIIGADTMGSQR
jgi:TonB family protein